MFNLHGRNLWIGSLLLAGLFSFAYGWKHREGNPPATIFTRTQESPEVTLERQGRYDQAVAAALDSIKDEKKDYARYQWVAALYYDRAVRDPANREKWIEQASLYMDKSVSLGPSDALNVLGAAFGIEKLGDASSAPCAYYTTASKDAEDALSELKGDSIFVGDEKTPTQPIRDDIEKLLNTLQSKTQMKCASKP